MILGVLDLATEFILLPGYPEPIIFNIYFLFPKDELICLNSGMAWGLPVSLLEPALFV